MAKIDWKKRCLRAELNKYKAEGNIVDIKNNYWKYFQKDKCNSFELKYNDLKKHKLFISKEERDNLKEKGKWIWRSTK
jgi:ribosomal protein L19E